MTASTGARSAGRGSLRGWARAVYARYVTGSPTDQAPVIVKPALRLEDNLAYWSGRRESNPHLQFGNRRSAIELHPHCKTYHDGQISRLFFPGCSVAVQVGVNFV